MPLVITEQHGAVRHLVLNRPDKRNAFNGELVAEVGDALRAAAADTASHCVVIRGAGPMFSSGMDLAALGALAENPDNLRSFRKTILDAWNVAEEMAKPTICVTQLDRQDAIQNVKPHGKTAARCAMLTRKRRIPTSADIRCVPARCVDHAGEKM